MDADAIADLAEDLATRPFPNDSAYSSGWLEGLAQSAPGAHFAPIAISESLYETPADDDGSITERYDEVYNDFEHRRRRVVAALTARWGPPQPYALHPEFERVMGNGESLPMLDYDLALFTCGEEFPAWRRDDRLVGLLLGQMDKEFPIVLTLAVFRRATE